MYQHILVATDGSELSEHACRHALDLAKLCGARVTAINVQPEYAVEFVFDAPGYAPMPPDEFERVSRATGEKHLSRFAEMAKATNVPYETHYAANNSPADAIVEAAQDSDFDLIVMASHGRRGLSGLILGSETHKVLTHVKIPVLVHREP